MSGSSTKNNARSLAGVAIAGIGLLLCLAGLIFAFIGEGSASFLPGVLAVMTGVIVFALGKQKTGAVTAVLGIAVALFGLAASQGIIPGFQQTDHAYPQNIPQQQSGDR